MIQTEQQPIQVADSPIAPLTHKRQESREFCFKTAWKLEFAMVGDVELSLSRVSQSQMPQIQLML